MIRAATIDDAQAIAELHVRSWQSAYRDHFPAAYLAALSVADRAKMWTAITAKQPPRVGVSIASESIVGFVSTSASRDDDAAAGVGEINAMYVEPSRWRTGIGAGLMQWALEQSASRGWSALTLWVLRDNASACAFYEAWGWRPDGATQTETIGGAEAVEVRLRRAVPSP
ncbi:MAG: GNAT family N-acetyltransferase [Deltaproteobacteria bacterium]|nr:GNAT family N-acetyltransferase [Deltaproteobacteria bacterium]